MNILIYHVCHTIWLSADDEPFALHLMLNMYFLCYNYRCRLGFYALNYAKTKEIQLEVSTELLCSHSEFAALMNFKKETIKTNHTSSTERILNTTKM